MKTFLQAMLVLWSMAVAGMMIVHAAVLLRDHEQMLADSFHEVPLMFLCSMSVYVLVWIVAALPINVMLQRWK